MSISEFLAKIADEASENQENEVIDTSKSKFCPMCRDYLGDAADYCPDCQKAIRRGYQISALAGRCRTGSDQTGTRWHARLLDGDSLPEYEALCGYAPKGRSGGWSTWRSGDRQVNCPKCIKKMTAYLHLDSWAGRAKKRVEIIKETPKQYKVRLLEDSMKGRAGKELYVPKYAIGFEVDNECQVR